MLSVDAEVTILVTILTVVFTAGVIYAKLDTKIEEQCHRLIRIEKLFDILLTSGFLKPNRVSGFDKTS